MEQNHWDYIAKSLNGTLSAEEADAFAQWLAEDPLHRQLYEEAQRTWELTGKYQIPLSVDTEADWEQMMQKAQSRSISSWRRPAWVAIAASVLLFLGLSWVWVNAPPEKHTERWAAAQQIEDRRLADGSSVALKPGGKLQYDKNLIGETRRVELSGEAFFNIQKAERPFEVLFGNASLKVLGTQFGIRSYPDEKRTEVFVAEGRVMIQLPDTSFQLVKGQAVSWEEGGSIQTEKKQAPNWGWKNPTLSLDNVSLDSACVMLSLYFDEEIVRPKPTLANCRTTIQLQRPSFGQALDQLTRSLNLTWARNKSDQIELSGPPCP